MSIAGIMWEQNRTIMGTLVDAKSASVESMAIMNPWRLTGHVTQMVGGQISKQAREHKEANEKDSRMS